MLTVGSLFSGIGGLEKGLEDTGGFRTVWQCEIEPYPSAVLRKHWPGIPNLGDITKVRWEDVKRPDLICGGFPCQDISWAGKGAGIEKGARSSLWFEYAKAIRILRPRYALMENVPALTHRGLSRVLASLAEIGYDAEWFHLSAADVGAWHKRERIFILAYTDNGHGRQEKEICTRRDAVIAGGDEVPDGSSEGLERTTGRERGRPPEAHNEVPDPKGEREIAAQQSGQRDGIIQVRETPKRMHDCYYEWCDKCENSVCCCPEYIRSVPNSDHNGAFGQARSEEGRRRMQAESCYGRGEVPNLHNAGLEGKPHAGGFGFGGAQFHELVARCRGENRAGIWAVEPRLDRVANGVPRRMDRIKCLGNSVVPQVAEAVGRLILEFDKEVYHAAIPRRPVRNDPQG